jgi:hypothetical protein
VAINNENIKYNLKKFVNEKNDIKTSHLVSNNYLNNNEFEFNHSKNLKDDLNNTYPTEYVSTEASTLN